MPRGDGTGPAGMGPMTGRAAGYCAGYSVPGFANPTVGRGAFRGTGFFGGGFGRGRGYRNMYYATGLPGWYRANVGMPAWGSYQGVGPYPFQGASRFGAVEDEKAFLKDQSEFLKSQISDIETRLEELEKNEKQENK